MRILQLSDLHAVADGKPAFQQAKSLDELQYTIDYILKTKLEPDVAVVTGDVSTDGSVGSYELVRAQLSRLPCPVYVLPGNHDSKPEMRQVFGAQCILDDDPAECGCIDLDGVRLLLMDSAVPGKSWGRATKQTIQRLQAQLPADPKAPVLVFLHQVPFRTGYTLMDEPFENEAALLQVLSNHGNVQICCGHVHGGVFTRIDGMNMMVCPPVSMLMELDLSPEGGDRFYTAQPGFALHVVQDRQILTHFACVPRCDRFGGPYEFIE